MLAHHPIAWHVAALYRSQLFCTLVLPTDLGESIIANELLPKTKVGWQWTYMRQLV